MLEACLPRLKRNNKQLNNSPALCCTSARPSSLRNPLNSFCSNLLKYRHILTPDKNLQAFTGTINDFKKTLRLVAYT
jgi:hypothetical protein